MATTVCLIYHLLSTYVSSLLNSKNHCLLLFVLGRSAIKFVSDNEQGSIPKCLSLRVTAIRETFEESGILLCKKVNCDQPENCATVNHLEIDSIDRWRKLVQKNASNFINLCSENNCYPDVGALHLWSNWLTPPLIRTQFDTTFFLAFMESSVNASPDGVETSQMTVSIY